METGERLESDQIVEALLALLQLKQCDMLILYCEKLKGMTKSSCSLSKK